VRTDERIAELAEPQGGHVTRAQLIGLGMSQHHIDYRVKTGRLMTVHRGVYAVGHLPTEPLDVARGVLLATGKRSALARRSAAAFWSVERAWCVPFEVISPAQLRVASIVTFRSSGLLRRDVVSVRGIRVTSAARTLLDMAPLLTDKRLTRAVEDLRHARRVTLPQIKEVLERNRPHPGCARLMAIVAGRQKEPTRSDLEDMYLRLVAKYELPVPQVNVHVAGYRVDAYYPEHDLVVELDGWMSHQTWQAFVRDRRQDAEILATTGIPTMRLTDKQMTVHGRRTAAEVLAVLEAGAQRRAASMRSEANAQGGR